MDFVFTPEQDAFRAKVRGFIEKELTPELRAQFAEWLCGRTPHEGLTPAVRKFGQKLGANGWLGMSWPVKYGGRSGSAIEEFILIEELGRQGLKVPTNLGVYLVAPTILRIGTEEQKAKYLPRVAQAEIEFALGYTEPQAGSDLAALQMQALEEKDCYVLSGQKMFNTACHYADYHWLAARTDPKAPKHKGISLFIVDLKSPGITIRPLRTMDGGRTNEVFYDDVRVPKENLVGERGKGFYYAMTALNFERITLYYTAELVPVFQDLIAYARKTHRDQDPLVRQKLAALAIEIEAGRLLSYRVMWMLDQGRSLAHESAMAKAFITEVEQHAFSIGMEIMGHNGLLEPGSRWAQFEGQMQRGYLATRLITFGGGTSEIMRNIIATAELGLPRE